MTLGTGGAHVLIWGVKFGAGESIWGLNFRGSKCAYLGCEIWGR